MPTTTELRATIANLQAETNRLLLEPATTAQPAPIRTEARVADGGTQPTPAPVVPSSSDQVAAKKLTQATLAREIADQSDSNVVASLQRIDRVSRRVWLVVFLIALIIDVFVIPYSSGRGVSAWFGAIGAGENPLFFAIVAGLSVWIVVRAISRARWTSGGVLRVVVGADNRISTSYLQAWLWTIILVWVFAFFAWQAPFGLTTALSDPTFTLDPNYLLLLGGPFAALVVAQGVNQAKLTAGDLQKSQAIDTSLKDAFSNDAGRVDLVDTQYLLFNFVAIAVFAGLLWHDPTTLPALPDDLVLLTSTAALGYIGQKAIRKNAPAILSIVADVAAGNPISCGDLVRISGLNFVPTGANTPEGLQGLQVKFGNAVVPAIIGRGSTGSATGVDGASSDDIRARVPDFTDGLTSRSVDVIVVSAAGVETPPYSLRVETPPLRVGVGAVLGDEPTRTLQLNLLDVASGGANASVSIGGIVNILTSDSGSFTVPIPAGLTGIVPILVSSNGKAFSSFVSL